MRGRESLSDVWPEHPRAESLKIRERIVHYYRLGVVSLEGLIAHGRGEAFDYLLGEETTPSALKAIHTAAAALLLAQKPVISVNGNAAALASKEIVELAEVVGAGIEVNLFHRSLKRELAIKEVLEKTGAEEILGIGDAASARIPEIFSERRRVDPRGILTADVVLVPLEDGDRTEALRKMGKTVIAIDLNPLSRTAQLASITIVDNIVRVMPLMVKEAKTLEREDPQKLRKVLTQFDNSEVLGKAIERINRRLFELAEKGVYLDIYHDELKPSRRKRQLHIDPNENKIGKETCD